MQVEPLLGARCFENAWEAFFERKLYAAPRRNASRASLGARCPENAWEALPQRELWLVMQAELNLASVESHMQCFMARTA